MPGYSSRAATAPSVREAALQRLQGFTLVKVIDNTITKDDGTRVPSKLIKNGQFFAVNLFVRKGKTIKQSAGNRRHEMTFNHDVYQLVGDHGTYWDARRLQEVEARYLTDAQLSEVISRFKTVTLG